MIAATLADVRHHHPDGTGDRIAALTKHLGRRPAVDEPIPLATWLEIAPGVPEFVWDLRWCWRRGGRAIGIRVICRAAERAISNAPESVRPVARDAVKAARGHIAGGVAHDECVAAAAAAHSASQPYGGLYGYTGCRAYAAAYVAGCAASAAVEPDTMGGATDAYRSDCAALLAFRAVRAAADLASFAAAIDASAASDAAGNPKFMGSIAYSAALNEARRAELAAQRANIVAILQEAP